MHIILIVSAAALILSIEDANISGKSTANSYQELTSEFTARASGFLVIESRPSRELVKRIHNLARQRTIRLHSVSPILRLWDTNHTYQDRVCWLPSGKTGYAFCVILAFPYGIAPLINSF